ncbi:MAG: ferredoxin [Lentisphaerae bacterium]|nr:ferredoxin [Lentisphaerota bacterium]
MKTRVDPDTCTSCEDCCQQVPDVFEMGDAGCAVVKVAQVPAALEAAVREAAKSCPASAIEVTE